MKTRCGILVLALALLVPAGCVTPEQVFFQAVRDDDFAYVSDAIAKHPECLRYADRQGRTAMHWAALQSNAEMIVLLAFKGAAVDVRDKAGQAALHKALTHGHVETVKSLLTWGADADAPDRYGRTPLETAAGKGLVEVVALLLEHGADPNLLPQYGGTALHSAVSAAKKSAAKPRETLLSLHLFHPSAKDYVGLRVITRAGHA